MNGSVYKTDKVGQKIIASLDSVFLGLKICSSVSARYSLSEEEWSKYIKMATQHVGFCYFVKHLRNLPKI